MSWTEGRKMKKTGFVISLIVTFLLEVCVCTSFFQRTNHLEQNTVLGGVIIIAIAMIGIAFVFALLQARRVKKIEPYQMLVEE